MIKYHQIATLFLLGTVINCSPYDDGKYSPQKFRVFDDGKYYRPLSEGKYIPGDEGKYTYVYTQGLYPTDDGDYRYIHQVGPNGGFGGNGGNGNKGGFGGNGGNGGDGPDGPGGPNGPNGPNGPSGPDNLRKSNKIEYIGRRIYAERYPYIHKIIKALVNEYVSADILNLEGSSTHYSKVRADNEVAVKCQFLNTTQDKTEFVTQYPPHLQVKEGQKLGSYYSFKGNKVLSTVSNSLTNKVKLEYEVFVRIIEDVTD